ncbi:MAG TPA: VOC family protein, partial [Vicinamibacterales bacterium]|nr:VOC family protein [Vicinamibacterales bacterium]
DDLQRARRFYENVFGWRFEPWGPPGFYLIHTGTPDDAGVQGAMQKRRELVPGQRTIGYECTVGVDSADAAAKGAEANGGKVIMAKTILPTVGELVWLQDPEGNIVGAMKYDEQRKARMKT